jgi:AraC-like DNA-binding protein
MPHVPAMMRAVTAGSLLEISTAGIGAHERMAFWREAVLKRLLPIGTPGRDRPFQGRLRRIVGDQAELVEQVADAIHVERRQDRCASDGLDDISIDFMLDFSHANMDHGGAYKLRPGDLCVMDYARPCEVVVPRHRCGGLILPRRRVREALGHDMPELRGLRLPRGGISALLLSHVRMTIDEAPRLSPVERVAAVKAAADMALAALQAGQLGAVDVEQFEYGFYYAACRLIERRCTDPQLTPRIVAAELGCSRPSLYRAFLRHGESVAAMIWTKRIERARTMLTNASHAQLLVSEVAFRCGFLDQPTFNRMFKRRFGLTPREARICLGA